jgi:hypothetical protein
MLEPTEALNTAGGLTLSRKDSPPSQGCPLRRIWEVAPDALQVVLGVLVDPLELERLLAHTEQQEQAGIRDDALLAQVVARCSRPCAFAAAVEELLEQRTDSLRDRLGQYPMVELSEWWADKRENAAGADLAAFFWALASDRRPELERLTCRVLSGLRLRGLRLIAEQQPRLGDSKRALSFPPDRVRAANYEIDTQADVP